MVENFGFEHFFLKNRGANGEEEALLVSAAGLERGSCVPVLVEDLALVHPHEPVESHDEH